MSLVNLQRAPVLGGTPQQLVRDIDSNVTFSPDGHRIAFARSNSPKPGILSLVVNILLVPSILAIVFGIRGRAASVVAGGRGLATAGLVMGTIGIVGSAISFFVNLVGLTGFTG